MRQPGGSAATPSSGAPVGRSIRVHVLRSGSAGNAVLIAAGETRLLVDAGLPVEVIGRELAPLALELRDLTAVLLTHEHDDHARSAGALARLGIPVLGNARTLLHASAALAGAEGDTFTTGVPFRVGEFLVESFAIPHDAVEPVGFLFQVDGVTVLLAHDLGDVDGALRERLPRADLVVLEANYDPRLLGVSGYPWFLKNRILSPVGHLSNDGAAGAAVWAARGGRPQTVHLVHLSEANNLPPLARDTVRWALEREGIGTTRVAAVRPNTPGPLWEMPLGVRLEQDPFRQDAPRRDAPVS